MWDSGMISERTATRRACEEGLVGGVPRRYAQVMRLQPNPTFPCQLAMGQSSCVIPLGGDDTPMPCGGQVRSDVSTFFFDYYFPQLRRTTSVERRENGPVLEPAGGWIEVEYILPRMFIVTPRTFRSIPGSILYPGLILRPAQLKCKRGFWRHVCIPAYSGRPTSVKVMNRRNVILRRLTCICIAEVTRT